MADGGNYRVKASVFRAHLKWLEQEGTLQAIRPKMSPATAALAASPPLGSTWISSDPVDELVEHVEALEGLAGVRRLSRDLLEQELGTLLMPMVKGVMRVIGGSPPTLYKRMQDLTKTMVQDVDYIWSDGTEKEGTFTTRYPKGESVPIRTFISGMAALEKILEVCNVTGTVGEPVRRSPNSADYHIAWK
jgi:hypothetical protein